jgi:7-cyano-7-deazaguanine synthase in queuosine biosynthesis
LCNSGGKDSSYTLKLAVKHYGLKVLSFTLDNGFIPQQTFSNIRTVVDSLGVDHITIRPSFSFMSAVIRASALLPIYSEKSQTRISSGCNSCISLVNTTALKMALEKKIPFILAGFTLGQIPTNGIVYRNHFRFFADSRKKSLERLSQAVGNEVNDYYGIPDHILDRVESYPHNINLLCLENITEKEILSQIRNLGWEQPQDVDGCSSNCTLNTFNNYVHYWQYGYNPYEFELSQLIRKGLMSREEALEKIQNQPRHMLPVLAEKLGLPLEDQRILGIR